MLFKLQNIKTNCLAHFRTKVNSHFLKPWTKLNSNILKWDIGMTFWHNLPSVSFFSKKSLHPIVQYRIRFLFYENLKTYHRPVGTWWGSAWERSVGCRYTSPHPGAPDHLFWQTNKYYKSTILTKKYKVLHKKGQAVGNLYKNFPVL